MSIDIVGYVQNISSKQGVSKAGKSYTVYNVVVLGKDGQETRIGWGFNAPSFQEGVWIKTQAEQSGDYLNYKNAPVETANGPAPSGSATQSGATGTSSNPGSKDGYWAAKEKRDIEYTQPRISYQNSRTAAITLVETLRQADALPISAAKSKSAEATRYQQILDIVNKLTVQFYNDVDTLRLLESVADAGDVEVTAGGDLPEETTPEPSNEDDFEDDIPF